MTVIEMFANPRPNCIESDAGFSVEVLGRTGLRYSKGDDRETIITNIQLALASKGYTLQVS